MVGCIHGPLNYIITPSSLWHTDMVFTWSSLAFSFPTSIYTPLKVEKKSQKEWNACSEHKNLPIYRVKREYMCVCKKH
jgi:hypothetical protein